MSNTTTPFDEADIQILEAMRLDANRDRYPRRGDPEPEDVPARVDDPGCIEAQFRRMVL